MIMPMIMGKIFVFVVKRSSKQHLDKTPTRQHFLKELEARCKNSGKSN